MNRRLTLALVLALALLAMLGTAALAASNPLSVFAVPSLPVTLNATYCDLTNVVIPPVSDAVQACLNTQANTTVTFNSDGTFTTGVGVPGTFTVDLATRSLTLVDSTKTCEWTNVRTATVGGQTALAGPILCDEDGTTTLIGAAVIFVPVTPPPPPTVTPAAK